LRDLGDHFYSYCAYAQYIDNFVLTNVTACGAGNGFAISLCSNVTVRGCRVFNHTGSYGGIRLYSVTSFEVTQSSIFGCSPYGLMVQIASGTIWNNRIGWNAVANAYDDAGVSWDDEQGTGNWWSDYGGSGTYAISGAAGSVDNYPQPLTDTTPPTIAPLDDVEVSANTPFELRWNVSDEFPKAYEVYRNGSVVKRGAVCCDNVSVWIFGDPVGIYNYTLVVSDYANNTAVDTVWVTVVSGALPTIDHPADLSFTEGTTGHVIIWHPSSPSPDHYELYRNGTLTASGPWDGSPIEVNVSDLDVGVCNFTLVVYDALGLSVSDTVIVTVTAASTTTTTSLTTTTTTTTETSTTTSTTTATTGPQADLLLPAAVVAGVAVVAIAAGWFVLRPRLKGPRGVMTNTTSSDSSPQPDGDPTDGRPGPSG